MNLVTQEINVQKEKLTLTNQRVLYWESRAALILSDVHIGKSAHFQKSGIPVSSKVFQQDLWRLEQLILRFKPKQLVVVGDLFHAEYNTGVHNFKSWTQQFAKFLWTSKGFLRFPLKTYSRV